MQRVVTDPSHQQVTKCLRRGGVCANLLQFLCGLVRTKQNAKALDLTPNSDRFALYTLSTLLNMESSSQEDGPRPVDPSRLNNSSPAPRAANPYKSQRPMDATKQRSVGQEPEISVGAIDNSLSWPWKHPDAWRR